MGTPLHTPLSTPSRGKKKEEKKEEKKNTIIARFAVSRSAPEVIQTTHKNYVYEFQMALQRGAFLYRAPTPAPSVRNPRPI